MRDIASAAAQAGEDRDAVRAAQGLADAQERVEAMLAALNVQLRAGRSESVRQTLEASRTALSSARPSARGVGAMAALAVAHGKIGDPDAGMRLGEAFAAAEKISQSAERSAAYLAIAAALAD